MNRGRQAFLRAEAADREAARALAGPPGSPPAPPVDVDGAWRSACRAVLAVAGEHGLPAGWWTSLPAPGDAAHAEPLSLYADAGARLSFLHLDAEGHAAAARFQESLAGAGLVDDALRLRASLTMLRHRLWFDADPDPVALAEVARDSGTLGLPQLRVEAVALRALAHQQLGETEEALKVSRRACRMARTEGIPWPEFLANLVLARARRYSDRPHLALRIVSTVGRFTPAPWLEWVAWEASLAGGYDIMRARLESSRVECPLGAAVSTALLAVRAGDRPGYDAAMAACRARVSSVPMLATELTAMHASVDPTVVVDDAPEAVRDFCSGRTDAPVPGLSGLTWVFEDGAEEAIAWVYASGPDASPRRCLGIGRGFCAASIGSSRPGRTETAIAVLLLGLGEPMHRTAFFRTVYGFELEPALHSGPLEVLLHRVRGVLGDAAELERADEMLRLRVLAPLSVPDPRCTRSVHDQLLRALASLGPRSAREAAKELGVALRTAQRALKDLAEEGACVVSKDGRKVQYRVEDTTFSEPTSRTERRSW